MIPNSLPPEQASSDETHAGCDTGTVEDVRFGSWTVLKCVTPVLVAVVWLVGHMGGYIQDVGFPICPAQVMEATE